MHQSSVSGKQSSYGDLKVSKSGNLDENLIKDITAPLKAKTKDELLGKE